MVTPIMKVALLAIISFVSLSIVLLSLFTKTDAFDNIRGLSLKISPSSRNIERYGLLRNDFVPLDMEHLKDFLIVTGASRNHFEEAKDAVLSMQRNLANHKIFFYDLGLTEAQASEVKQYCNVTY
eukprot:Selendium_serpulae@DN6479_c6_g1_i2.p1